ncbi:MAG: acyloxyacyl hydrolase [Stellaceae bacterium]
MKRVQAAARGGLFALTVLAAAPAAAQMSLGSPGDPPRIALEGGAFDVLPDTNQATSRTAALIGGEYRFGDRLWFLAPFVGLSGTSDGAFYGYFGFGFDIDFGPHWVLTPNVAAGYFARGGGTDLGSWWEFRSGAEIDYRFSDFSRLGVAVHHISNAGLTRRNPGEESVTLVYTVPIP